jgi:ATP/maltotriose-dependent transcriptional regulator MalT
VATRTELPVHAARLEAAGRLTVLGPADLVFDARECGELLRARRGSEPQAAEVDAVLEATEGWPLGVATAAIAGGAAHDGHAPAADGRAFAFLAEEVLDRLPAELAADLEASALPVELDAVTVGALGLADGFVDDVRQRGLFLGSAGAAPGAVRYHPLFRALLLRRGEERGDPARRADLHARLAATLQAAGRPADAVEHWFAAGLAGEAAGAIAAAGAVLTRTAPEDVIALADGFDAPEAAELATAPATALVTAVALAQLGRIAEAQALAARAFAHPLGGAWAARCAWQGLFIHMPAGRLDDALAAVDDDLRDFPREDPLMSLAYPLAYRAQVLEERGEEEAALAAGEACEADVRRTALGGFVGSLVCARRAMLLARRGLLGEATAEIERAEAAVVRSWWRADIEIARACIEVARGEPAAAGAAAERAGRAGGRARLRACARRGVAGAAAGRGRSRGTRA